MLWPLADAGLGQTGGVVTATSLPTTITGSGSAHTMGSWTELIAATTHEASLLWILSRESINTSGSDTSLLLDIGIGAAASEAVLVPSIMWGHHPGDRSVPIPIYIPAGSRISARCQSAVTSKTIEVTAMACSGGWLGNARGHRAISYGSNAATSSGTAMATPAGANTKGAWTQLSAATTGPVKWLIPFASGPAGDAAMVNLDALVDIGYGGAGSEQVLVANIPYRQTSSEFVRFPQVAVPANLPAGTRLAARHQATVTTEVPYISVIGVD